MVIKNNIQHRFRSTLVGRTYLPTGRNRNDIMAAIRNRWGYLDGLEIIRVTDEIFIFNFTRHNDDLDEVLRNQPWSVYGQVLLLNRFIPGTPPQQVPLLTFNIWFSFVDLLYSYWFKEDILELLQNVPPVTDLYPQFGFPTSSVGSRVRTTIHSSTPLLIEVDLVDEYGILQIVELKYENFRLYFAATTAEWVIDNHVVHSATVTPS